MHIAVIGAGVMGLLTSLEFLKAGMRVSLFDKGLPGEESSWAGGGIVSPLYPWRYSAPITTLAAWAQSYYPSFCAELHQATGIDPQFDPLGLLMLDAVDADLAIQWAQQFGRNLVVCGAKDLPRLEPAIGWNATTVIHMPDVGAIRNPRLLKALLAYVAMHNGIDFHFNEPVAEILNCQGSIEGVLTSKQRYKADAVVLTAGAWSSRLLDAPLPVKPVRGQMIALHVEGRPLSRIVLRDGTYLIPRRNGLILAGSTLEFTDFDKSVTESAREWLRERAVTLMPQLARAELAGHWAGLRPGSPDGVPFIGEWPSIQGLYLNVGHYRNGLVLAPAACRLTADIVLGRSACVNPEAFSPARLEHPISTDTAAWFT